MNKSGFYFLIVFVCKQGKDEAAEKQRIKEEQEKEEIAERVHQLRLAANEEAKVSYLVDSSYKLTHYMFPFAW